MNKKVKKPKGEEMSRKRTKYSNAFKVKLVLELLKGEKTLSQIASENNVVPKNLQNWKKQFLENAEIAMDPAGVFCPQLSRPVFDLMLFQSFMPKIFSILIFPVR